MNRSYDIDSRLTLRLLEPHHAEELFDVIEANRQAIVKWMD